MMFKKYAEKISNSLGTINYIKKKSNNSKQDKDNNNSCDSSSYHKRRKDPVKMPKTASLLALPTAHIVISTTIEELRHSFIFYTLVYLNLFYSAKFLNFLYRILCS